MRRSVAVLGVWLAMMASLAPGNAWAQEAADPDPDLQVVRSEPDFTLGVLPTTLRMPAGKMAFRVTHRFTYKINEGGFGRFLENGLGLDASAVTGLEFRIGIVKGGQFVVHRSGSKNIQFMLQQQVVGQDRGRALSLDLFGAIEGQNNFRDDYSFAGGAVISRRLTDRGAVYLHPMGAWNVTPEVPGDRQNAFVLGMGARLRLGPRSYVVAEFAPRLAGYDRGASLVSIGLERRVGGHLFQINVSNGFDATLAPQGRGGPSPNFWHLGFNLSRKFF